MAIWNYEVSVNGDDSVLITDLKRCRDIKDVDRYINKMIAKKRLMDKFRSCISKKEVKRYKSEITKEKVGSVSSQSALNLAKSGAEQMKEDNFSLDRKEDTLNR